MKNTNLACKSGSAGRRGFTLIELLVVIAIMAILAGFTVAVLGAVSKTKQLSVATAEVKEIEAALESYKAEYGVYPPANANAATKYGAVSPALYSQLYYELSGMAPANGGYTNLDGGAAIASANVNKAFGVDGFLNCSRGSGEEAKSSRNFLLGLKPNRTASIVNQGVAVTNLVLSLGGPDQKYDPLGGFPGINPIRYQYPGTNNPASYDLWVQVQISGTKYLVANWTAQHPKNDPAP